MHNSSIFLETERLFLKPLTPEHLQDFVALDSDPEVMRYLTGGAPQSREHFEDRFEAKRNGCLVWG